MNTKKQTGRYANPTIIIYYGSSSDAVTACTIPLQYC